MSAPRRRPKRARAPSDVFRHRAVPTAAVAAALAVVVVALATGGRAAFEPRGRPALPHSELECGACHAEAERAPASSTEPSRAARVSAACVGCHGEHTSRRGAHRALAARGSLECGACHAVHRAEDGVRFAAGAPVVHYGTGFERELAAPTPRGLEGAQLVPLVARERCAACHDPNDAVDPASGCFAAIAPEHNLCFDEHRAPADARGGATRGRDVATEAARSLVLAGSVRATSSGLIQSGLALAASMASAFAVTLVVRRRRKAAQNPAPAASAASTPRERRLPQIDALRCLGCHACVDACPYDVLEVERYVARVARPDDCCGLLTCERACPNGSLVVLASPAAAVGPAVRDTLELIARPGLYVAGDASGSSLIRNAVRQGANVARHVRDELAARAEHGAEVDLAIVGAGPAGLSAALQARKLGLRVVVVEQATIAESIRRFSRGKLVLDADADSDESLPLFVGETHKEELLARWMRGVREAGLNVRENARATAVHGEKDAFRVELRGDPTAAISARRVLVAIGRRGSPRKLDAAIPELAEGRVHYELSDAQAFAGRRVVIVGLGDVAMEAALALAAQPGTHVSVLHRGRGFRRGKRRNIDALSTLVARGRIRLEFESHVTAVGVRSVDVQVRDSRLSLDYDALFVLIGALPAGDPLEAFGVPAARY